MFRYKWICLQISYGGVFYASLWAAWLTTSQKTTLQKFGVSRLFVHSSKCEHVSLTIHNTVCEVEPYVICCLNSLEQMYILSKDIWNIVEDMYWFNNQITVHILYTEEVTCTCCVQEAVAFNVFAFLCYSPFFYWNFLNLIITLRDRKFICSQTLLKPTFYNACM